MKTIELTDVALWVSVIVFIGVMIWWVFGSSPTVEQISLTVGVVGSAVALKGMKSSRIIRRTVFSNNKLLKQGSAESSEQTQVLKDIRSILRRKGDVKL